LQRLDCRRIRSRCRPQRRRVLRRRRRLPRDWRANDRLHTESTIPLRDSPRWRNLEARFEAFPRPSCRDGQMPNCDAKGYCRSVEERALIERIRVNYGMRDVVPRCERGRYVERRLLALLGPREMSELSPQGGSKQTLVAVMQSNFYLAACTADRLTAANHCRA